VLSKGFRIARIAGIDVVLDWSLVFIFTLIAFSLSMGLFPAWHPEWSSALNWATGLSAAVLFFASVLAHEMSHALVGRAQGMEINRITLFIFGGMAHLRAEPRNWRAELRMAAVGPVTSLVLGVFFMTLAGLLTGPVEMDPANPEAFLSQLGPVASLLTWLGPINIVLGLFNLVPGFPLDGGRILRALLWGITGDLRSATRWASELGRGFAWLLILLGVGMVFGLRVPIFGSGPVSGLWLAFIGWFLHNAALTSYRQLLIKETLEEVPVKRLMRTRVITLEPDLTVEALVNDHMMGSDQRAFPVTENSRFMGLVCLQDVRKIARDNWPGTSVKDIMTAADQLSILAPNDDAAEALFELARRNVNQLPVVSEGGFQGLVTREDILKWLMLHGERGNET
jgi:Zn-dependent protease/predicted transcriptional regulator